MQQPRSQLVRRGGVWVAHLNPNQGVELRECWAMAEQPRALDRKRIALDQALRAALGLAGG